MKKLLIVVAFIGLSCGVVEADGLILTPLDQSAPVSTTATFSVLSIDLSPSVPEFVEFSFDVISGPDTGQGISFIVQCFVECTTGFTIQNNGTAGTDTLQVAATPFPLGFTQFRSGTVTWTAASVPEPNSLMLLGIGLLGLTAVWRR